MTRRRSVLANQDVRPRLRVVRSSEPAPPLELPEHVPASHLLAIALSLFVAAALIGVALGVWS